MASVPLAMLTLEWAGLPSTGSSETSTIGYSEISSPAGNWKVQDSEFMTPRLTRRERSGAISQTSW